MIHVVLADDHRLMREGLTLALKYQPDITIVGEAMDGAEALRQVELHHPDVLLLDIFMPVLDGIAVARRMAVEFPEVRVVVLTMDTDPDDLRQLRDARIAGFVTKDAASPTVARAIRAAMREQPAVPLPPCESPRAVGHGSPPPLPIGVQFPLTARERQILCAVVGGASNKQIAAAFALSERTVRNHLYHIFRKIAVEDRTQAALLAVRYGLCRDLNGDVRPDTTRDGTD